MEQEIINRAIVVPKAVGARLGFEPDKKVSALSCFEKGPGLA